MPCTWYWKCGASQRSVPAIGLTWSDQRQPGWRVSRPISLSPRGSAAGAYGGTLALAFKGAKTRFCVVSFNSDWLYPTAASRGIVHALNAAGASVSFVDIDTDRGHDAFLLDVPEFIATTRGFLEAAARARGLPTA